MFKYLLVCTLAVLCGISVAPTQSQALSCLPVEDYLKTVVNDEVGTLVFTATTKETITEKDSTIEVLEVKTAHQGYVAGKLFVYHAKDDTWGYYCNNGPKGNGVTSVYIVNLDQQAGLYHVNQRLEVDSESAKTLLADLKKAEVSAEVTEFNATDRQNQIMTTIKDLFALIGRLLTEFVYWKNQ